MIILYLAKTYDTLPRQEVWRYMTQESVSEKDVEYIKGSTYDQARTRVSSVGTTLEFPVEIVPNQGSSISSYIIALIMDAQERGITCCSRLMPDGVYITMILRQCTPPGRSRGEDNSLEKEYIGEIILRLVEAKRHICDVPKNRYKWVCQEERQKDFEH